MAINVKKPWLGRLGDISTSTHFIPPYDQKSSVLKKKRRKKEACRIFQAYIRDEINAQIFLYQSRILFLDIHFKLSAITKVFLAQYVC